MAYEGPFETDGAPLARNKEPSETDGAPSQIDWPPRKKKNYCVLLESGRLREMATSSFLSPR